MARQVELPEEEAVRLLNIARELTKHNESLPEAMGIVQDVLLRSPNNPAALHMAGYILLLMDNPSAAYQYYKRCLMYQKARPEVWSNFGRAADELHRYEEGLAAFQQAIRLDPNYVPAWANASVSHINMGNYPEALKYARRAVEIDPDHKNAWINVGYASLALHDWKTGWDGYHKAIGGKFRPIVTYGDEPEWDGERVHTLVVTGEQGIGDEIMFAQMIRDAAKDVECLVYDCHPRLEGLFRRSFADIANVHVFGTRKTVELQWLGEFRPDAHISLADLGRFYRDDASKFTREPYIVADPERVLQWRALFESWGKPVIGLAWSGGNFGTQEDFRRIGLEAFRPVIEGTDAVFVSLEYRDCAEEIAASGLPVRWFDRAVLAQDYDETAGLVAALDSVMGIHTSSLHLAAAMGKSVQSFIPDLPQWRYYRDDMPWYRDWRMWRQKSGASWAETIRKFVASGLKKAA